VALAKIFPSTEKNGILGNGIARNPTYGKHPNVAVKATKIRPVESAFVKCFFLALGDSSDLIFSSRVIR
jgi:hypothetical protein